MIKELILSEEKRFERTLQDGEKLLLASLNNHDNKLLEGEIAFKLYDTYGFPVELTEEIAQENGFTVDMEGFNKELEAQKERARASRSKGDSFASQQEDLMNFNRPSSFNYDATVLETEVIAAFVDGKEVESFTGEGVLVFKESLFYAESGGQVSDSGTMKIHGNEYDILAISKARAGQHLHTVDVSETVKVGDVVELHLDAKKRHFIRKNHSAVHLLQSALRTVLGDHVTQAGSYVDDQYLRFDFSHFEKVKDKDLNTISLMINNWIADAMPVVIEEMDVESAKETGAMALFSDNYGDVVRVVSMGDVSKELCGGTHVSNISEIGVFKIVSEESVGSGVRRITAVVSLAALKALESSETEILDIRSELKIPNQKTTLTRVQEMVAEIAHLEVEKKALTARAMSATAVGYIQDAKVNANDISLSVINLKDVDADTAKLLVEKVRDKVDVAVLTNAKEESVSFVVGCSEKAIQAGFKAGDIAKQLAVATGGNGGGRPNFAQAGGKNLEALPQAISELEVKLGF